MDELQSLWQNQPSDFQPMLLDEIRRRAARFQCRIGARNRREFAAGVLVLVIFSAYAIFFSKPLVRAGSVLIVLGVAYVMLHLYRSGRARPLSIELGRTASLDFYREELTRQRDLLASVWKWYLAPPLPGLVLVTLGAARTPRGAVIQLALTAVVFGAVWALNWRGAATLSRKIDELNQ